MASIDHRGGERRPLRSALALAASCLLVLALTWTCLVHARPTPAGAATAGWTAYVTLVDSNTVIPIDTATNMAGAPIAPAGIGSEPEGIAVNPAGTTAYVSQFLDNTLSTIDVASNTAPPGFIGLPGGVSGGAGEVAITPDGSTALVVNGANDAVDPVDLATGTVGTPITFPAPVAALAITPDGGSAYVASGTDTVSPVDLATAAIGTPIVVGSNPVAVAVDPSGTDVYVANAGSNTVSVIDTATNTVTTNIPVDLTPVGLAVSPDGTTLYVANINADTVSVVDTATDTVTTDVGVGTNPQGLAVTPDGASVYVANSGTNTVSVIDAATDTLTTTVTTGGFGSQPFAIAITPDQAPHAALSATAGASGTPTTFDASSSTAPIGTIASYAWTFGDGASAVTTSPTTSHVYTAAGTFTASVTETSSGGTSTTQVYTGQTVSRQGGPSARASVSVSVPASPGPAPPAPPAPPPPSPQPNPQPQPQPQPHPQPQPSPFFHAINPPPILPKTKPHHRVPHPPRHVPNPLVVLPTNGTPGMAVTLTDRRLSSSCPSDHTVYVFFDNQLVAQAQAAGSVFSQSGILIPGDAPSGAHRFELSCTEARPWLAATHFRVDGAADHPMGWITALPHPGDVHNNVSTWFKSALISGGLIALLLLFLGVPAEWFNDTYDANKERMMEAARRRFPTLLAARGHSSPHWWRALRAPTVFVAFLAIAALFQGFLDPSFGWNTSSLWLFLGWGAGVAVVTLGFQLLPVLAGVRTKHRVRFQVLVGSILVAGLCVLASRALGLEPGYCYGLIAVFAFFPMLPEEMSGRLAAASSLFVLALSAASYGLFVLVSRAASHPHPAAALLVLQAALGVVFVLGVESVSFGMLPLPFLPGRDVAEWNRWAWGGLFGVGMVAFIWILLQPGSGVANQINHVDLLPVVAACAVFTVIALAFMAYFKFRKPSVGTEEDDAPVGLVG